MANTIKKSVKMATVEYIGQMVNGDIFDTVTVGNYTEKRAAAQIKKQFGFKNVIVKSFKVEKVVYEMPIETFIANATEVKA